MLAKMQNQPESWVTVATALDERRAAELALVLTARGIAHQRLHGVSGWELWVPTESAELAASELTQYRVENSRAVGQRRLEEFDGSWPGVATYAAVLLFVFVALHQSLLDLDWLAAGRSHAARVVAGEWWRVVTALTVHVDLDHLAGNLAFGAFFGYFVGRYLGRGVGWLAILAAGAAANALNALVQMPEHRSIGASTAVFAALGLLTAFTWRRGFLRETPWRGRIAPIVAGIGLLAFTGTAGENTDLLAHLFGFVAGFVGGVVLARWAHLEWLQRRRVQSLCAGIAALTVLGAWVWALVAAG
jgi:membrane associated rhomboid family serine protease